MSQKTLGCQAKKVEILVDVFDSITKFQLQHIGALKNNDAI